jgi:hypothetical protein
MADCIGGVFDGSAFIAKGGLGERMVEGGGVDGMAVSKHFCILLFGIL